MEIILTILSVVFLFLGTYVAWRRYYTRNWMTVSATVINKRTKPYDGMTYVLDVKYNVENIEYISSPKNWSFYNVNARNIGDIIDVVVDPHQKDFSAFR